jgi:N-glycosylase/DNA lyase
MQRAYVSMGSLTASVELPDPEEVVADNICWGAVEAFPTPAYWAYQVIARRLEASSIKYRLGNNLKEEVGACLLGGHGIPARVGVAAFEHMRRRGAFSAAVPTYEDLHDWLSEPLHVNGRDIQYRFTKQKARYLREALDLLSRETAPESSGRSLRDWLLQVPGIGYKTASWIARNWLDADDVAILDIHILRAGILSGFFDSTLSVERHYLTLEAQFLAFSHAIGVRPSELDALIWYEMMTTRSSVQATFAALPADIITGPYALKSTATRKRHPYADQLVLVR